MYSDDEAVVDKHDMRSDIYHCESSRKFLQAVDSSSLIVVFSKRIILNCMEIWQCVCVGEISMTTGW